MAKHKTVFTKTLAPAIVNSPRLTNSKVSKLKVEKVERPPQKPVSNNGRIIEVDEKAPFSPNKETAPAKTKQLETFAQKVAQGKAKNCIRVNQTPNA